MDSSRELSKGKHRTPGYAKAFTMLAMEQINVERLSRSPRMTYAR